MKHCTLPRITCLALLLLAILTGLASGQNITVAAGSVSGAAGSSVVIPINLASLAGAHIASLQWTLSYSSDIASVTFAAGIAATNAGKSLTCNGNKCLVFGSNATVIADGIVATATVQIAASPSTSSIPIQITAVAAATPTAVSVTAAGVAGTVTVLPPPALSGLTCAPTTVITPGNTQCTISLTTAAPPAGFVVPLASNKPSLTVPASVTVNAGQTTATFTATAALVSANTNARITAGSGTTKTFTLSLVVPASLVSVTCAPASLNSGATSVCTVTLSKAAPAAMTVAISSNNALVAVPASLSIAQGQTTSTFQAMVGSVLTNQSAVITTTLSGQSMTATLNLLAPVLSGLSCAATTLNTPANTQCTITLATAAPASGFPVPVASNNASLTAPASVTVSAGQTTAVFTATAAQVAANLTATLTAGSGSGVKLVSLSLVAPAALVSVSCAPATNLTSGTNSACSVSLNKAAVTTALVSLSSSSPVVSVPASLSIAAGQSSAAFQAAVGTVTVTQPVIITASLNGQSVTATINLRALPVPSVDSVSPSASAGAKQTFTFVFSDSQNATNLSAAAILFAPTLVAQNSCYVVYDATRGTIQLQWDNMVGNDNKPVAATTILQNSQCAIGAATVTTAALTTTITLDVTFKSAFTGLKNIYMYGADGDGTINTGWVTKGAYTVAVVAPPVPAVDSVSPANGTGFVQTFSFAFSDSQSSANLSAAAILFAPTLAAQNSCYIVYDRNRGTIQLLWDNMLGNDNKPVGSFDTLQNSQCSIGVTSVTTTALTTTITMDVTFKSVFSGLKNVYMYGADGDGSINTGWVQKGTYTVAVVAPPTPSADSASPNSGAGSAQTFSFVFSDSQSASNITTAAMLVAPGLVAQNSCFVVWDKNRGTIQLEWDDVTGAQIKPVGAATTLQNSQCTIGAASVTATELSVTITLDITFKSAFSGAKNIYMYGADGDGSINTGWVQKGTWTPNP